MTSDLSLNLGLIQLHPSLCFTITVIAALEASHGLQTQLRSYDNVAYVHLTSKWYIQSRQTISSRKTQGEKPYLEAPWLLSEPNSSHMPIPKNTVQMTNPTKAAQGT